MFKKHAAFEHSHYSNPTQQIIAQFSMQNIMERLGGVHEYSIDIRVVIVATNQQFET